MVLLTGSVVIVEMLVDFRLYLDGDHYQVVLGCFPSFLKYHDLRCLAGNQKEIPNQRDVKVKFSYQEG